MRKLTVMSALILLVCAAMAMRPGIKVDDAKLGTGVENMAITGEAATFPVGSQVYVWMHLSGGTPGEAVTVNWKFGGAIRHAQPLTFNGRSGRTWAWKNVDHAGQWTVSIDDASGTSLKELSFTAQ